MLGGKAAEKETAIEICRPAAMNKILLRNATCHEITRSLGIFKKWPFLYHFLIMCAECDWLEVTVQRFLFRKVNTENFQLPQA